MAKSAGGAPSGRDELPQHPYVERLKPDPSKPAKRVIVLTGLPSNSDRAGYQRLYLTTKLDYYAEFLASDKVYSEAVGADQSPFPGHQATRVSVSRDATIHYIWRGARSRSTSLTSTFASARLARFYRLARSPRVRRVRAPVKAPAKSPAVTLIALRPR